MNSSTISLIKSGKASAWILPIMGNSLLHKAAHFVFRKPNSLLSCQHLPSWDFHPLILVLHSRFTQRKVQVPFQGQFFKYMSPRLLALVPSAPDQVSQSPRRESWIWILILSLTSCVALSKLFCLSEPVSSYVCQEKWFLPHWVVMKVKLDKVRTLLSIESDIYQALNKCQSLFRMYSN